MKLSDIDAINKIYTCSKSASLTWKSIEFPEFSNFTYAVQKLLNAVGDLDEDDYWYSFLKKIKRFRFDAVASPLSEEFLQESLIKLISDIQREKKPFITSHPNANAQYEILHLTGKSLVKTKLSQLLLSLSGVIKENKNANHTAILVCETRLVSGAEQGLASANISNVEVTSKSFLREDNCFENLIIIGPTRWYPKYIFDAPRAKNLLILKYAWIRDSWKHQSVFVAPLKQRRNKLMEAMIDDPYDNKSLSAEEMLLPSFDYQNIKNQLAEDLKNHHEVDFVKAKLCLLEEGWAVFLEAEEFSSVLVIDLSDLSRPVKKVKASEIEPGMYVLLRTTGGGDFIIPVANQIMGPDSGKARDLQQNWKKLLRARVVSEGYEQTITKLLSLGSIRASGPNLRNWMYARNIKTEFREDFNAIMKLAGLDKESDHYWKMMEIIGNAHQRAGMQIRKMLLEKVEKSDLAALKRTGKMDFELADDSSISITAFQIKEIAPETMQVLHWQIGDPILQGE
jgi:hypothetical protein